MTNQDRPMVVEINCTTGEKTERFYTDEEIADMEKRIAEYEKREAELKAEAERIAAIKQSAKAKLVAGEPLTEEEASVLVI